MPSNQVEMFSFGRGMPAKYDFRVNIYPSFDNDHAMLLFDPELKKTFYLDDLGADGTYELDNDIYYRSVKLSDSSGSVVTNPLQSQTSLFTFQKNSTLPLGNLLKLFRGHCCPYFF